MPAPRKYPAELRERAVRLVFEIRQETGQKVGSISRVADQLGVHREALREWVKRAEIDAGQRPGTSTSDAARIAELERKVKELERSNAILRAASGFLRAGARPETAQMSAFIDAHRETYGVELICKELAIAPSTYYAAAARKDRPAARDRRDEKLKKEIIRVYEDNFRVYGARKITGQLRREGIRVARCTVERLMRVLGLTGAVRGKKRRTTVTDPAPARPKDLVNRDFTATAPNQLWVTDFTYVAPWAGTVYVAFVVDVFSRKIVGWRAADHMRTSLVLDALEMAIWSRDREGLGDLDGLVHHSDAGSQYLAIRYTQRLSEAGAAPSVGTVGDALDNALMESTIGLFKTETIKPGGPWRTLDDVELATLTWVDWYNNRRLHSSIGDLPPTEYETVHYRSPQTATAA
ncbi:IS3 family transposase [Streptomyces sp. NPDC005533]|uniref:IS3 family transposase n=1 Tax=Streptomyces sp. NPDC005533 TaxID=3364723 RepID=UPI0036B1AB17